MTIKKQKENRKNQTRTFTIITGLMMILLFSSCTTTKQVKSDQYFNKSLMIKELSDEFNGTGLDKNKWIDQFKWKGRKPGLFKTSNIDVSGGELKITARTEDLKDAPEGYHTYTTAIIKSKTAVKYGYFEIRAKAMKSKASSAFWFYKSYHKVSWTEIDVFEISGFGEKEQTIHTNRHVWRSPTIKKHIHKPLKWQAPFKPADDYHIYALDWTEDYIRWYVDGKMIREDKNEHWHYALDMCFDSEIFKDWFGLPDKKNLPSTFHVDYVRSWKTKEDKYKK